MKALIKEGIFVLATAAVMGFVTGAIAGYKVVAESTEEVIVKRDALRQQCLAGNDRACRMYEVDFGGGL